MRRCTVRDSATGGRAVAAQALKRACSCGLAKTILWALCLVLFGRGEVRGAGGRSLAAIRRATPRLLSEEDIIPHNGTLPRTGARSCPRPLPQNHVLTYVHIAKTGGDSFMKDSVYHMPEGVAVLGNEELPVSEEQLPELSRCVTFLRHPYKHVLSQYLECKYDPWFQPITNMTGFPGWGDLEHPMEGLEKWVSHFLSPRKKVPNFDPWKPPAFSDFYCYDPWNMQTRHLAPASKNDDHHVTSGLKGLRPNVEEAERRLEKMFFVGITDLYKESLCLFHFSTTGAMPLPACECGSTEDLPMHHDDHNVPRHSLSDLSMELLMDISKLVGRDVQIFIRALRLFEARARKVKERSGVTVLCEGKVQALVADVWRPHLQYQGGGIWPGLAN